MTQRSAFSPGGFIFDGDFPIAVNGTPSAQPNFSDSTTLVWVYDPASMKVTANLTGAGGVAVNTGTTDPPAGLVSNPTGSLYFNTTAQTLWETQVIASVNQWVNVGLFGLTTPGPSTVGAIYSHVAVPSNFLTSVNTDGTVSGAQPAASDLSNGTTGSGGVVLATTAILDAQSDNGILHAEQFAGVDIGAKINAAYAALSANGGRIKIKAGAYSFSTAIVFGINGKNVILEADGYRASLTYTGSGTAITFDNQSTSGSGDGFGSWGSGLRDFDLIGLGGIYGSGNAGTAVSYGPTNGGVGIILSNVRIAGFSTAYSQPNGTNGNGFGFLATQCRFVNNTVNVSITAADENVKFDHCIFTNFGAGIVCVANNVVVQDNSNVTFDTCSFDSVQTIIGSGGGQYHFSNCHFEMGPGVTNGTTTVPILVQGGQTDFSGCDFLYDPSGGSVPAEYINVTGGVISLFSPYFFAFQTIANAINITTADIHIFAPRGQAFFTNLVTGPTSGNFFEEFGNGGLSTNSCINTNAGYQYNGAATTGHVLRGNGTNFIDAALAAADLSNGVTGTAGGKVVLQDAPALTGAVTIGIGGSAQIPLKLESSDNNFLVDLKSTAVGGKEWQILLGSAGGLAAAGSIALRDATDGTIPVIFSSTGQLSTTGPVILDGATPTTSGTQVGVGNTTGFGNGSAGTAVTTTTKSTGTGPTTPQTIVKYLEIDLGGTKYWIPLVQ